MDLEGDVGVRPERLVQVVDTVAEHGEELAELVAHLRVRPHEVDRPLQGVTLGEGLVPHLGGEHVQQPSFAQRELADYRSDRLGEQARPRPDPLLVVDVEEAADGAAQHRFVGSGRSDRCAGRDEEVGPALSSVVHVVEVVPGLVQEASEIDVRDGPEASRATGTVRDEVVPCSWRKGGLMGVAGDTPKNLIARVGQSAGRECC